MDAGEDIDFLGKDEASSTPVAANTARIVKAESYDWKRSNKMPAITGPAVPLNVPKKSTIPKMAPCDLIPKYSATEGDTAVNNPP